MTKQVDKLDFTEINSVFPGTFQESEKTINRMP